MLVGRVNFYLAIDADKRTKGTAISRIKTIRMAAALLYGLRRADAKRRKGNRAVIKIAEQRTKGNFLLFALFYWHRHIHNVIDHAGGAVHGLVSEMRIALRHCR